MPGVGAALAAIIFMGADNSPLTEGPLPLAGARGIWCGAELSAIDMGRRYQENRG